MSVQVKTSKPKQLTEKRIENLTAPGRYPDGKVPGLYVKVTELQARLLRLQRTEEAIIERLETDGMSVRRTCVDPLVLLGIE